MVAGCVWCGAGCGVMFWVGDCAIVGAVLTTSAIRGTFEESARTTLERCRHGPGTNNLRDDPAGDKLCVRCFGKNGDSTGAVWDMVCVASCTWRMVRCGVVIFKWWPGVPADVRSNVYQSMILHTNV